MREQTTSSVRSVEVLGDRRVHLIFSDRTEREIDLSPLLWGLPSRRSARTMRSSGPFRSIANSGPSSGRMARTSTRTSCTATPRLFISQRPPRDRL